jgi:peptidoglycan/xylan/chitin deacetylase (PgdA/CDA1 family)
MAKSMARIEIPPFPGGKRIAVTTSFDDGVVHDRRVVESFNAWGLKGTFNLNSGRVGHGGHVGTEEVAVLYAGHEVAVHTVTHPWLERLDASQVAAEVQDDRRALEDLVQYPVRGMAYPFGTHSPEVIAVLKALGIVYARTTANRDPCFPATEPLAWPTTAHQYAETPETVPQRFERQYANPRWSGVFFVWGHTYEFDRRNDWGSLERIFRPLSGRPDVWYCTNIQLFDYEAARRRVVLAVNRGSAFNPSALAVTLNVDGRLVDVPPGATLRLSDAGPGDARQA